jgi:RNA polymerase sigma factor (sigma-70 family)
VSLDFQPPGTVKPPDEIAAQREQIKMLLDALTALPPVERWIVMGAYGIGCEHQTLEEMGSRLKLSRERVRQIKVQAMSTLRTALGRIGDEI